MHLSIALLTLALAALPHSLATGPCTTDEDCSLNGRCVRDCRARPAARVCKCDPGWWGEDCGRLDLAPARRGDGYNHTSDVVPQPADYYDTQGNSSWGGTILQDRSDPRLFHLVTAQFGHGCGLGAWRPQSFVVWAESRTGPRGPYRFVQKLSGTFRHNPYVFWSEADGKYLMYTIGVDVEAPDNCKSVKWPNNISVSVAPTLHGPWSPFQLLINGTNPAPWPAYTPHHRTSEIILATEDLTIYTAPRYQGPYTQVSYPPWNTSDYSPTWAEDPFLWRDKRGHWHTLAHYMIDIVEHGGRKYPRVGAHMFARHLRGPWHFHQHEAYNSTVSFTDGSAQTLNRRERPKLFFSSDGEMTPLYLVNGVQDLGSKASYTLVQPIGEKWKEFEKGLGF